MTLFCVRDGDSDKESNIWNAPLKKVERAHDPNNIDRYKKTGTPGVIIDTISGKMETQIPENEEVNKGLGQKSIFPYRKGVLVLWEHLPDRVKQQFKSYMKIKCIRPRIMSFLHETDYYINRYEVDNYDNWKMH
jgi:hypothetical protein